MINKIDTSPQIGVSPTQAAKLVVPVVRNNPTTMEKHINEQYSSNGKTELNPTQKTRDSIILDQVPNLTEEQQNEI